MPDNVRREGAKVWIAGMERSFWGGTSNQQNSVMGALTAALNAMGDPVTYEYLMGMSGAAFRLQFCWCPSAPHALCGRDCVEPVMKRTGYSLEWIKITDNNAALPGAQQKARAAVMASIEAGRPVLQSSEECGLIVGYDDNGESFLVRPYSAEFSDAYSAMKGWPWSVGLLGPRGNVPDRRASITATLADAVTMARTPAYGTYTSGFAAFDRWIAELRDDAKMDAMLAESWWPTVLGNGYTYGCFSDARRDAAAFLRTVGPELGSAASERLLAAATQYGRIGEISRSSRDGIKCCWSLMPWDLKDPENWTREMRHTQGDILAECRALEVKAVAEIEAARALL